MYHNKRKTYPGRTIVKGIEIILVVAIALFGLAALDAAFRPQEQPREVERVIITRADIQPQYNFTQPESVVPETTYSFTAHDYFMMGLSNQQDRNYRQAIQDYTSAIELDPSFAPSWLNRGVAYEQINAGGRCGGNKGAALNDYWEWVSRNSVEIRGATVTAGRDLTLEMSEGRMYIIPFTVKAGDIISVSANSVLTGEPGTAGVVDPLVLILDGSDKPVAGRDDTLQANGDLVSMNPSIRDYMVMQDGTYSLIVSHAGGGSYGTMTVSLTIR